MLKLTNIVKNYKTGDTVVKALKNVNIEFRKNEFVSVLGPSGCGKTTLLNIIGGLDRYTSGDLSINGKSTKEFRSADWDSYRNHSIGFVFQNYNLISHQSVLSNVELALTLSGVSKSERRKRAKEVLEQVGLGDQLHKKPNQMSGGQMQRVAIARALINDPEILLADEPTGALDSETSVQVMEILKEVAKDRLVIMVTHNPELAEKYSTRIVRFLDGEVIDDTDPFEVAEYDAVKASTPQDRKKEKRERKKKKTSMSFFTALSLSFNNLLTKKARTFLTAFAGSIGIIGIALILSLSSGAQADIAKVEEDTLSSYPITIESTAMDMAAMMSAIHPDNEEDHSDEDKIYSANIISEMLSTMTTKMSANDLKTFKAFLESDENTAKDAISDIQYRYSTQLNIYRADTTKGVYQINPSTLFEAMGIQNASDTESSTSSMMMTGMNVWSEMLDNRELLDSQYDVVAGKMPEKYNEVVIVTDENNQIDDYTLYALGLMDPEEFDQMMEDAMNGKEVEKTPQVSYTYDELLDLKFKLLINTDYFVKENGVWVDQSDDDLYMTEVINNAEEVSVVGILRPKEGVTSTSISGTVGYLSSLTQYLVEKVNDSEIVKEQKENPDTDIFTGFPFVTDEAQEEPLTMEDIEQYIATLPETEAAQVTASLQRARESGMTDEQILAAFEERIKESTQTQATYDGNLSKLGVSELDNPSGINIYPTDFEAKETITTMIDDYNTRQTNAGKEELTIQYTDIMGILMSSVSTIINAISYILISFVAISLVVSSIMIGIITYISVLERTKEIGILRAIGASKRDISRVFNAETLLVGFTAGLIGIGVTLLLIIPINAVIYSFTEIPGVASLPVVGAVILVAISMALTFIAGLIPSRIAAKKDPVEALRSE